MRQVRRQDGTSGDDDELACQVTWAACLLGRYVMTFLPGERAAISADDEKALAELVAVVAAGMLTRAETRAARGSGALHSPVTRHCSSTALRGAGRRRPTGEVAVVRWPFLARLTELPGPPWRITETPGGAVTCLRSFEQYTENVCVIGIEHVRLTRTPIHRGLRRTVAHLEFTGPFDAAVAVLREPVRWEDEP